MIRIEWKHICNNNFFNFAFHIVNSNMIDWHCYHYHTHYHHHYIVVLLLLLSGSHLDVWGYPVRKPKLCLPDWRAYIFIWLIFGSVHIPRSYPYWYWNVLLTVQGCLEPSRFQLDLEPQTECQTSITRWYDSWGRIWSTGTNYLVIYGNYNIRRQCMHSFWCTGWLK
jgi:hypothetical protein